MAATSAEAQKSMADIENCKKQVDESIAKAPVGLSSQTLKEFTESLRKVDQVVVEAIPSQQGNIINDVDVSDLVTEYFGASLETLQFLNELEHCLRVLENSHTHLLIAIEEYMSHKSEACLENLEKFKAHGDPFQEKFFPMFGKLQERLQERQKALLAKVKEMQVEAEKKKEEAESSSCSWWGHLFGIVALVATVVPVVCAAVALVLPLAVIGLAVVAGVVPSVAGVAAVAVVPGVVGVVAGVVALTSKLISNILNAQTKEERLKNREKLTTIILHSISTTCIIHELDSIGFFAKTLEGQIVSLKKNINEAHYPEALDRIIELVKKQTKVFLEDISDLTGHARKCKDHIFKGRDDVDKLIQKFT